MPTLPELPNDPAASIEPLEPIDSTDLARWRAVQQRDQAADGQFWYSVKTTGVYCRPSCGARTPLRKNVAFHASCAAAEEGPSTS